jgi:acetate kinase
LLELLQKKMPQSQVVAVAHRVVHGGERFTQSIVINFEALAYLQALSDLVPLHQANSLEGIRAFSQAYPQSLAIACFDTGFHADLPVLETLVPLPATIRDLGIRRFGFHGLSYRSIVASLSHHSDKATLRVVAAHLGSGASVCGIFKGKSLVTSMGFSALDGLMMGSRCGTLDPGILLFLLKQHYSADQLENMLYRESGLLGVSGVTADMRTLRASVLPSSVLAINLFTYRLVREIGATVAALGGIDVMVFTGGIGENDVILREKTCAALSYFGVKIDQDCNLSAINGREVRPIHATDSKVEIWVIPSNENKLVMQDALALLHLNGGMQH